jgi:serine protease
MFRTALISLFVLSGVVVAQTPRTILEKPDQTVIPSGYYDDQIFVRIHEGIDAQTAISSMTNQRDINAIAEIAGATWRMLTGDSQKNLVGEKLEYAERRLGREIADPRQGLYLKLPMHAATAKVIDALNTSPLVEIALPVPIPEPASFTPPDYQSDQGYENPAAYGGIGAETVWSTFDIHGEGVQVCDIEWDFNANHCDFPSVQILGNAPEGDYIDHGTAVLGVMVSLNDGVGTTGISHGVDAVKFASLDTNGIPSAILLATNNMPAGSVILLEVQMSGPNGGAYVPVEWYEPWYNSVLYAIGNDMIVCEAAGNGYQDLDASVYSQGNGGHYPFLPENDSGAIMIGAGGAYGSCGWSEGWKQRLPYSNYGSRVDVQGWGECVYTTGYGDAWSEPDCEYTSSFSGTSSATPIVAGACILIQSYAIRDLGGAMLPEEMRSLLIQTGQPQVNPSTGHIGPLPDAYAAISSFFPDGACCVGTSGACIEIIEPNCNAGGGSWMGPDTICADGHCEPISCEGDADESGTVDVGDLLSIIDQWGLTNSPADVNSDGIVDVSDLLIVVGNWGPCE